MKRFLMTLLCFMMLGMTPGRMRGRTGEKPADTENPEAEVKDLSGSATVYVFATSF